MTINQFADYTSKTYNYSNRLGNLTAEAVGVIKGEKHFPVFADRIIFKPLTKSKPLSTPLFAYAEVFWSWVINTYFMPVPQYRLAFCEGYEAETGKNYDYGTAVPFAYGEGEQLMNLLEFFRKYPDENVKIDDYLNYCQMFYDYTEILESTYFQTHQDLAEELAMQILVSVLKGDQNYHYENIAFVCNESGEILRMAPMIDHEFSTYFMFPDSMGQHMYWFGELERSIEGREIRADEYDWLVNETERHMMEKSATCLHKNLVYIREHYPLVAEEFLRKLSRFENDLIEHKEWFAVKKSPGYPDHANSDAWMIGKARYKDHDEVKAANHEVKYGGPGKKIKFDTLNSLLRGSGFKKILADYEGQVEFNESKMPVFDADNDDFTLTLYNLNYGTNYATQVKQNDTQGDTQDDTQEKIIKMIEENPRVSTSDMAKRLGIGIATVKRKIKKMPNISYVGSGYSGHWEIK